MYRLRRRNPSLKCSHEVSKNYPWLWRHLVWSINNDILISNFHLISWFLSSRWLHFYCTYRDTLNSHSVTIKAVIVQYLYIITSDDKFIHYFNIVLYNVHRGNSLQKCKSFGTKRYKISHNECLLQNTKSVNGLQQLHLQTPRFIYIRTVWNVHVGWLAAREYAPGRTLEKLKLKN